MTLALTAAAGSRSSRGLSPVVTRCDTRGVAGLAVRVTDRRSADGPFRVIELAGEADAASRHLKDVLDAEAGTGPPLLVIDMSQLTFMDSWALHVILTAWKGLRAAGRVLALAGPAGSVRRVLDLAGADTVVPVYPSVQEATGFSGTAPAASSATPPQANPG